MILRRTKIVATLGPASSDAKVLEGMIEAGLDVVRMNFSHGTAAEHGERVNLVRTIARRVGRAVGVLVDLQGPKIRIGKFRDGRITLESGAKFVLDAERELGGQDGVGLDYKNLPQDVRPGDTLLLDDGRLVLNVSDVHGSRIATVVEQGGVLSNNKGINRRGGGLTAPALTDKDMRDIVTAAELKADFLGISFPRSGADIRWARELMRDAGGNSLLVAKIERAEAITALDEILDASDAIMVARGDLAVEVGDAIVPALQKRMIRLAREKNKGVITATQMMESMISNPIPTRAEVSDVANAVLDGTDAVMLSGETAVGSYPVETVASMARVCVEAEKEDVLTVERRRQGHSRRGRRGDCTRHHLYREQSRHQGRGCHDAKRKDGAAHVAPGDARADLRHERGARNAAPGDALPRRLSDPVQGDARLRGHSGHGRRRTAQAGCGPERRLHRAHHRRAVRQGGRHQYDENRQGGRAPPAVSTSHGAVARLRLRHGRRSFRFRRVSDGSPTRCWLE